MGSMRLLVDAAGHKANLKQYQAISGNWQFVSAVKINGKPRATLISIGDRKT
jgi:hypothetical protein